VDAAAATACRLVSLRNFLRKLTNPGPFIAGGMLMVIFRPLTTTFGAGKFLVVGSTARRVSVTAGSAVAVGSLKGVSVGVSVNVGVGVNVDVGVGHGVAALD
jgi:hypothetical protein